MKKILLTMVLALSVIIQNANASCQTGFSEVIIQIIPDQFPWETSWNLTDNAGTILASGTSVDNLEPLRNTVMAQPTPFTVGDAAIIDESGRMLLIRRADNGLWAMPGGLLDVGETAAAGVVREALEETGVLCEAVALAGVFDSRFWGGRLHQLYQFVFLCRPLPPPLVAASHAHEVRELGWFTEADLPTNLDPNHVGRIPVVFQVWRGERPPYFDQ